MQSDEIRQRFLEFFKNRGHAIIPSASLVPENDPSVLFTTAGMQPLIPFLMGEPHPQGKRLANVQKCVRTQDIEEVGDNTHDTFFEMLGNWSLGDYFKKEAIEWSYQFLTDKKEGLGLDAARLYITVFAGDENAPRDEEAAEIWKRAGIPANRIYYFGAGENWWPAVKGKDTWTGPTGPDTEMFYDVTPEGLGDLSHEEFMKADNEQKIVEVWNDVFMAYEKKNGKIVGELKSKNVDTGAGLERLAMVLQKKDNIFETDLFEGLMAEIDKLKTKKNVHAERIVADHIRTATFLIADGVAPSNTDRGYILRRLLRRAVRYADAMGMRDGSLALLSYIVVKKYTDIYSNLAKKQGIIEDEIRKEEKQFRKTLERGLKELHKIAFPMLKRFEDGERIPLLKIITSHGGGEILFNIFSTYGFPLELSLEEIETERKKHGFSALPEETRERIEVEFQEAAQRHQELSRAGAEKKFKGGLADTSEKSLQYHTATHLLHKALRDVLGDEVFQKGSNITHERLRFDFSFSRKTTTEEIQKVEDLVNKKIKEALPVSYEDIPLEEAKKRGAIGLFEEKYGEKVRVYQIGESAEKFSLELCGGPHVKNTSELGHFKIVKEEAVAQGVRRIRAILE